MLLKERSTPDCPKKKNQTRNCPLCHSASRCSSAFRVRLQGREGAAFPWRFSMSQFLFCANFAGFGTLPSGATILLPVLCACTERACEGRGLTPARVARKRGLHQSQTS